MNFKLFEKPMVEAGDNLEVAKDKANAWSLEVEKKKTGVVPSSGKVDTRRSVRYVALTGLMRKLSSQNCSMLSEKQARINYFFTKSVFLLNFAPE